MFMVMSYEKFNNPYNNKFRIKFFYKFNRKSDVIYAAVYMT